MKRSANEGGCWFCQDDEGDLDFQTEFDSYVHHDCVFKGMDDNNPEAFIIARELGLIGEDEYSAFISRKPVW